MDPDLIEIAANDAIVNLIQKPESYAPKSLSLDKYLRMSARGDLAKLRGQERRHQKGHVAWNVVAETADSGNYLGRDDDPSRNHQEVESREANARLVESLARNWPANERRVLELILEGRTTSAEIAPEIDLGDLAPEDVEREVKRLRDRVKARLRRARKNHE